MLDALRSLLPKQTLRLETKLEGVAGFTGAGSFRYALSPAGSADYEAELRGVAGLRCELFAEGEFVATLACRDGKVAAKFNSRLGDPEIRLDAGAVIEIRQNGDVVLKGVLKPERTGAKPTKSNGCRI